MQITLNNQEIKKALDGVKGGVDNNSNHIILSYVLIAIKNNVLTLTTTNSEIEIQTKNNIKESQEIIFTLCLMDLNNILTKLDDNADIVFTIAEKDITISTDKNKFNLKTIQDYSFYKLIDDTEIFENFSIKTTSLKNVIKKTKFSIALDSPQKYLNGLFLEITPEKITTASSDGHRLSLNYENQQNTTTNNIQSIIPKKTVEEFLKLLNATTEEFVDIAINKNYMILKNSHTIVSSNLIDGDYPDYKQIFPSDFDNNIIISREEFDKSLKQVEIFTRENKTIKLKFKNNELIIDAKSEKGSANSVIAINNFDKEIEISFNVSYLIQTLQNLSSDNIVFNIDDVDAKVAVLNNEGDTTCKYLIMAIKV